MSLISPAARPDWIKAGNAIFTLVSNATGTRFTFRVRKLKDKDIWFVAVLTGADNNTAYTYLGTIYPDGRYSHGKKSSISYTAPSARAARWFFANPSSDQCALHHEGRCCRCGRRLTVPSSILSGIGPECANRQEAA